MSLALRSIPRLLFRNFTPISPTFFNASRRFSARQRNWHQNIHCQTFCSSTPPANTQIDKHTRPPAQFPAVQKLSPRLPHISAQNNDADQIEQYLHEDGHHAWGFVIYRSTYQSNTAWDEFMRRLLADTTETLEGLGGLDLLDNLALTVFDDSGRFNGATTTVIRDHFKQWAATIEQQEQGPSLDSQQSRYPGSQRYRYCIQVTQEMLDSILTDDAEEMGFVRIIRGDWEKYDPYEDGKRFETEEEAIEGCTLEDVGWIKVPFDGVMVIPWCYLRSDWAWETEYRRPPEMACWP